jgi:hypothetical protein
MLWSRMGNFSKPRSLAYPAEDKSKLNRLVRAGVGTIFAPQDSPTR